MILIRSTGRLLLAVLDKTSYRFNDNAFPGGNIYYRLRMIDKSRAYYFSKVIRVLNELLVPDNQLLVVPNPVSNSFSLGGYFFKERTHSGYHIGCKRKKKQSFYETVNTGFNNMLINNLPDIQKRIYFIKVKQEISAGK
jgi:hypothetical protein